MIYVLDTHPIVWFLKGDSRLSPDALNAMRSPDATLIIPSIVIAELWHLYTHHRITVSPDLVRERMLTATNCTVYPLDDAVLKLLPIGFELHDAVIVATALVYRDVLKEEVCLITKDQMIRDSNVIATIW